MLIPQVREAQGGLRSSAAAAGVGSAIPIIHGDELTVYLPILIWVTAYLTVVENVHLGAKPSSRRSLGPLFLWCDQYSSHFITLVLEANLLGESNSVSFFARTADSCLCRLGYSDTLHHKRDCTYGECGLSLLLVSRHFIPLDLFRICIA